jgi:hypothetical protein
MTRPDVYRKAVISLRYTGPERRSAPRETSVGRFAVLLLVALVAAGAFYSAALVVYSYGWPL